MLPPLLAYDAGPTESGSTAWLFARHSLVASHSEIVYPCEFAWRTGCSALAAQHEAPMQDWKARQASFWPSRARSQYALQGET